MISKTVFKTRAEWLAWRNAGFRVGSSNVGTILGLNPYQTPLDLWRAFMEQPADDDGLNMNLSRGQCMEDGIAHWFEQVTGNKVIQRSAEISVFHNGEYPDYCECAPDREVFANGREDRPILEIKDTRIAIDMDNLDTIPQQWFAQIQYQMGMMGRKTAYIAINDGNKSLQWRMFTLDEAYFAEIMTQVIAWVDKHIIEGVQPEPINGADVASIYPIQAERATETTEVVSLMIEQLKVKKTAIKRLEKDTKGLVDRITATFTDNNALTYMGQVVCTWKEQARRSFDVIAFSKAHPEINIEGFYKTTTFRTFKEK